MNLRARIATFITLAFAGALAVVTPGVASVNAAGITLPWAVGQAWSTNGPHADNGQSGVRNAIDVTGGDGRVLAAADGTVRLGSCSGGQNFWIDHPGGWRTSYYHVTGVRVSNGQSVRKGDWIANTGTTTPCGGSASAVQLHFSLWKDGQPYALHGVSAGGWTIQQGSSNYLGTWRRDSDGYTYTVGSNGYMACGCVNNDGSGSASAVVPEGRPLFVSSLQSDGTLLAKAGLHGPWVKETSRIRHASLASDPKNGLFLVALDEFGVLRGKQGISGPWTTLASGISQAVATTDSTNGLFVAAVSTDGTLSAKQGMNGPWIKLISGIAQVSVSSDSKNGLFVGAVSTNGTLLGKQGISGAWTNLGTGISQVAVTTDPVNGVTYVARRSDGKAIGKQGMHAAWVNLTQDIVQVAASSDSKNGLFVGAVTTNGTLLGKQGISGAWTNLGTGISQVAVSTDPVNGVTYVARRRDGQAIGKQGMHGAWANLIGGSLQTGTPGSSAPLPGMLTLTSQSAPKVTGRFAVGQNLTGSPGLWSRPGVSLSFQWLIDGQAVPGAQRAQFAPRPSDAGRVVQLRVTAAASGYTTARATSTAAKVQLGTQSGIRPPKIKGQRRVGRKLTAATGAWAHGAHTLKYQWLLDGKAIRGAKRRVLNVSEAMRGRRVQVRLTVSRAGYKSVSLTSRPTAQLR